MAQAGAVAARPAAMDPGADHQAVAGVRIVPLDGAIDRERPLRIFGIEPAAHAQDRRLDVLHVRGDRARLPEAVVSVVLDVRHEVGALFKAHAGGDVGQRQALQEEVVAVGGAVVEFGARLRRRRRVRRFGEGGVEIEVRGQHEGAAVVGVVAHVQVGDRRLRRGGLDRRVRIDDAGRRVEARIADAVEAHLAVVVRDVLQQPGHGVVHVLALDALARRALAVVCTAVRRHFLPLPFRHVAPAHVLLHEDVAGFLEFARRADRLRHPVDAVAQRVLGIHAGAVGRALHQEGVALRPVLRHVDDREQLHAVAHRDAVFVLGVAVLQAALDGGGVRVVGGMDWNGAGAEGQHQADGKNGQRTAKHGDLCG